MTGKAEKVLAEAMELPMEERSEVIAHLLDSLDAHADEDTETSWAEEIRRRREEVKSGEVPLIPWEDVRAELFENDSQPPER